MNKLIAANWKMYKTIGEAADTVRDLTRLTGELPADRDVLIFPPFTAVAAVSAALGVRPGYFVGGQDVYTKAEGAFTGEISPGMLKDAGCDYALTGHSERRHVLGESDELVGEKTLFALQSGMRVILCIGEKLDEREAGKLEAVLKRQLTAGLKGLPANTPAESITIAYEPVWAIGTGKVAGPAEIKEAHALVRKLLASLVPGIAKDMRILYGGSVKADNAKEILAIDNVNGLLVGGASLQAAVFKDIILA